VTVDVPVHDTERNGLEVHIDRIDRPAEHATATGPSPDRNIR